MSLGDVVAIVGFVALCGGIAAVFWPASLIVGGALLLAFGLVAERP